MYVITCKKCSKQYVGETYRTYKERITEHMKYVTNKKLDTATGAHFNLPGHSLEDMQYQIAYIIYKEPIRFDRTRTTLELEWINRLRTFSPNGLNEKGK